MRVITLKHVRKGQVKKNASRSDFYKKESGRAFFLLFFATFSNKTKISCSVVQGSIFGPCLFNYRLFMAYVNARIGKVLI